MKTDKELCKGCSFKCIASDCECKCHTKDFTPQTPKEQLKRSSISPAETSDLKHEWKGNKCSCGYDAKRHQECYP